eukprot:6207057-Pleurochrysis_carterae.AAC.3
MRTDDWPENSTGRAGGQAWAADHHACPPASAVNQQPHRLRFQLAKKTTVEDAFPFCRRAYKINTQPKKN